MRILLVQPPVSGITAKNRIVEPLALEILASTILHTHEVKIVDLRIEENFKDMLYVFKPNVIGFTCYISQKKYVLKMALIAKQYNPAIINIVGGVHATYEPEDFNDSNIDYIIQGDGEISFPSAISMIENKFDKEKRLIPGLVCVENGCLVYGTSKEILNDLSLSPAPARHLTKRYHSFYKYLDWNNVASISSSRGCKNRCEFCSIWKQRRGNVAHFPIQNIINQLLCIEQNNIYFCDANSFQDIEYMKYLAEEIHNYNIKKNYMMYINSNTVVDEIDLIKKWYTLGLKRVFVGFEFINNVKLYQYKKFNNERINDLSIKILHDIGIEIVSSFIIDLDSTEKDYNMLRDWVEKHDLTIPVFNVLTPLPGSTLYNENRELLRKLPDNYFDFEHAVLPTKLPLKKYYKLLADLYRHVYASKLSSELIHKLGYSEKTLLKRKKIGDILALNIEMIAREHLNSDYYVQEN